MENLLLEYSKKIQGLMLYIDMIRKMGNMVSVEGDRSMKQIKRINNSPSKRILDYNLVIITLYGILEGFIEQIIEKYLDEVSCIVSKFSKLPQKIQDTHLQLSAELIININKLAKYSSLDKNEVVRNLYSCVDESYGHYKLNGKAYTNHSSNFRRQTICDIFKNIGIANITKGIIQDDYFKKFFQEYEGVTDPELKRYSDEAFYTILEDIVERRNYIAHGNDVDDILSLNILEEYVEYIRRLIETMYRIVRKNLYNIQYKNNEKINLGYPIAVYNNSIIGLYNNNNPLRVGMTIFSRNANTGKMQYGKIVDIEKDRKKLTSVDENENVLIGIKVDFKAKSNCEYGILI